MRGTELLRLVWLNINQNKFKSIMTSIGIVVGAATIMLVIGIGQGGKRDIAEQFAELNAGEINVSYEYEEEEASSGGGGFFGAIGNFFGGMMNGFSGGGFSGGGPSGGGSSGGGPSGGGSSGGGPSGGGFSGGGPSGGGSSGGGPSGGGFSGGGPSGGGFPGGNDSGNMPGFSGGDGAGMPDFSSGNMPDFANGDFNFDGNNPFEDNADGEQQDTTESETENESDAAQQILDDRLNQRAVTLSQDDVDDIETAVPDITGVTISYTTQSSIEGGKLLSAKNYTVAGVKEAFESVSRLQIEEGNFLTEVQDDSKARVCVLGSSVAKELFGSASDAMDQTIYIDDRTYTVYGVLKTSGTIAGGITLDSTIFVPYETGIKYITGTDISPKITVVAEDVDSLQEVIAGVRSVLEANYTDISFTFEDSGSKMKAAESSNRILTMLLSAMAAIVFVVGGIGIMNVLFVSVKERTNEIGILKAIGTAQGAILLEFLFESAAISFMGGMLGVMAGFIVTPIVRRFDVRVELTITGCLISLGFAILTGTLFGIYPAWKASKLEPVEALNAE